MCKDMDSVEFIHLKFGWLSSICKCMSFTNLGKFSVIIILDIFFFITFFLFPWDSDDMKVRTFDIVPQYLNPWSFSFSLFFLQSGWFILSHLQVH